MMTTRTMTKMMMAWSLTSYLSTSFSSLLALACNLSSLSIDQQKNKV